jgi:hypothetical protein
MTHRFNNLEIDEYQVSHDLFFLDLACTDHQREDLHDQQNAA